MNKIQVRAHCTKCGFRGKIELSLRGLVKKQPCPRCGLKTLEKDFA